MDCEINIIVKPLVFIAIHHKKNRIYLFLILSLDESRPPNKFGVSNSGMILFIFIFKKRKLYSISLISI